MLLWILYTLYFYTLMLVTYILTFYILAKLHPFFHSFTGCPRGYITERPLSSPKSLLPEEKWLLIASVAPSRSEHHSHPSGPWKFPRCSTSTSGRPDRLRLRSIKEEQEDRGPGEGVLARTLLLCVSKESPFSPGRWSIHQAHPGICQKPCLTCTVWRTGAHINDCPVNCIIDLVMDPCYRSTVV